MKILSRRIVKGVGFLKVIPVDEDDFWYLYNLISVGDIIRTSTSRKIIKEGQTGSKQVEKRKITLLLKHLLLSIKGRNCRESQWLSLGQFHTFEFEFNIPLVIYKENWDGFHFRLLDEIKAAQTTSDVAALVMEEGVAHLCLIGSSTTTLKQKIEKHVVKKRANNDQRDKSMNEFFQLCLNAIEQDNLIENVKCLIVASPGFVKDDFIAYLKVQVQKENYRHLSKALEKIMLTHSSTGYLNSLMEILQEPAVQSRLEDTKYILQQCRAMQEVKLLEKFFIMLRTDVEKVAYGRKDVQYAHSLQAIQILLLSDKVARSKDPKERKEWIRMVEQVKSKGGEVHVFSSLHPSGKQLNNFTGIVAILYFPIQYDYEMQEEEEQVQKLQHKQNEEEIEQIDVVLMKDFDEFGADDEFI